MSIVAVVVELHSHLAAAGHRHAFGGALALAHYAEPRATIDIDLNVFSADADGSPVLEALGPLGYTAERDPAEWVPIAGIRLRRGADPYPVDLFLPLGPAYEEIGNRARVFPFGPDRAQIPFLSAEDLAVFKLSFGRDKDWVDLRQIVRSGLDLDVDYIERQLIELRGPSMYPRLARLRSLVD